MEGEKDNITNDLSQKPIIFGSPYDVATELLNENDWLTPNWCSKPTLKWYNKWLFKRKVKETRKYKYQFADQLRAKYRALEIDFRTVLADHWDIADIASAINIKEILKSSRECLELNTIDLETVSSSLDLVERYMVWLYPEHIVKARIDGILLRLESMLFHGRDPLKLKFKLEKLSEEGETHYDNKKFQSVLDETIGLINEEEVNERIGRGLQRNRLKNMRSWGVFVLIIFLAAAPFTTNIKDITGWPSTQIVVSVGASVYCWINAVAMMILGAVGGYLSGLLQARSTKANLPKYEYLESMLKLQLRPLVGALVALILYSILSWQVLPGITIENSGSYFLIAFLSGFSERYFLRLLKKAEDEDSIKDTKTLDKVEG